MQIVIDIDEDIYREMLKSFDLYKKEHEKICYTTIANGTVLPKHGRLIDADKLLVHEMYGIWGGREMPCVLGGDIEDAPTILEAWGNEE